MNSQTSIEREITFDSIPEWLQDHMISSAHKIVMMQTKFINCSPDNVERVRKIFNPGTGTTIYKYARKRYIDPEDKTTMYEEERVLTGSELEVWTSIFDQTWNEDSRGNETAQRFQERPINLPDLVATRYYLPQIENGSEASIDFFHNIETYDGTGMHVELTENPRRSYCKLEIEFPDAEMLQNAKNDGGDLIREALMLQGEKEIRDLREINAPVHDLLERLLEGPTTFESL